jgi:hypothetical protein
MNGNTMTSSLPMTWARRVTLAVGVPVALALIGWTGFNVVALAGQGSYPVSYPVAVVNGRLIASLNGADMALRPGHGGQALLLGTVHYSLVRPSLTETSDGGQTSLHFGCHVPVGDCGLNATLSVPPQTALTVSSGGGDLSVSGFSSDLTLLTAGGDLDASKLAGQLRLNSSGGDIGATSLTSPVVTVEAGGGDVVLAFRRSPQNLRVDSDGGDIAIVLPRGDTAYNVTTSTGGGDLSDSVPVSSSATNTITVNSGGGDIDISDSGPPVQ